MQWFVVILNRFITTYNCVETGSRAVSAGLFRASTMCETTARKIAMPRTKSSQNPAPHPSGRQGVSLKRLAEHLGLSQAAVSLVINRAPGAKSIPHRTQEL